MRADLHTMEQIDHFLQGKLSGEELRLFEQKMAADPELMEMVNDQQLLIQTVNRKAILAEIHAVAGVGGTAWYANPFVGIAGATILVGGIITAIYIGSSEPENENKELTVTENSVADTTSSELFVTADNTYYIDSIADPVTESDRTLRVYPNMLNDPSAMDESQIFRSDNSGDDESNPNPVIDDVPNNTDKNIISDLGETTTKNRTASFPKGDLALKEFINENMRFPGTAREKKLSGNVKVKFLVTSEGTRTNIEATCFNMRDENDKPLSTTQMVLNQKVANLFEREAERIIRIMPAWIPATDSEGNPILVPVEMYFNFSLKEGNSSYRFD